MSQQSSDIAFTPSVKAVQTSRRSRELYAKMEARGGFRTTVTEDLAKGFIRVVDDHTIGFADFAGNRQYISTGNLAENDRAFLFLMDYAQRRRIKLWGRARVVSDDAELVAKLMPADYRARPEQAILFTIDAWDVNCPQHIPQKFDAADVAGAIDHLQARITTLEAENAGLRQQIDHGRIDS
jgi:predicted pyridoxine 5'-phosphate oxidase superfamily flavin-nucleotide-binding protein